MTLRRKMAYQIAATIGALLLISAASLWGVTALHQDFSAAISGYEELRHVYEVGAQVESARTVLSLEHPDLRRAMREIRDASTKLDLFAARRAQSLPQPIITRQQELRSAVRQGLIDSIDLLSQ